VEPARHPAWDGGDEVCRQDRPGSGGQDGRERDDPNQANAELAGSQPPGPAASGDAQGDPQAEGDHRQGGGLPGDGGGHLATEEPEDLEHSQVAPAASDRGDQGVGHGGDGDQGHQGCEQGRELGDALEVADLSWRPRDRDGAGEVAPQPGDGLVAVGGGVEADQEAL
jgi:hypothetical protein